ncbi:polysaccharide pyruvyl transferase family protein [Psychrobacillus psychrotolerans]|uniref:polysaccharide pyruvyl transferase family protein n=1 Tax=Psychrobacillus psychrotolerans TaxID=126156 RepID=UPI003B01353B
MKKNIMIYAYSKFNLGDDLFIKLLCERYSNTQFYLYAPKDYDQLFKGVSNLKIIPNDNIVVRGLRYVLRSLGLSTILNRPQIAKKCDGAVYIGGSLFIQNKKWNEQLKNNLNKKISGKPLYVLGANFGPYTDNNYYLNYKELFSGYTDICFRDKYSYNLFEDLPNVRLADDIIFQLDLQTPPRNAKKDNVVISVIKPSKKHLGDIDEPYYTKIRDIIIYLNEKGYRVTLMSFCEKEGDELAIEEILKLLPNEYLNKVDKYCYKYNIEEAINVIENSIFIVASRFHSMVLGWVYNKPVFPIAYSEKMTNVIEDVGFKGLYTNLNQIESLKPEDVYNSIQTNKIDVSKQIQNSKKHFDKLDEFLITDVRL